MRTSDLLAAGALFLQVSHACRATEEYNFEASSHSLAASSSGDVGPLRLLKTSDDDPGTWVTEEEKIHDYMLKHVHFMDVTETQVCLAFICA